VNEKKWSLLFHAAEDFSLEDVQTLVEANAELNLRSINKRWTALDRAICVEKKETGEYLRSLGAKCSYMCYPPFWKQYDVEDFYHELGLLHAAQRGSLSQVTKLVEIDGHDINR
jgi:hypothetical protein